MNDNSLRSSSRADRERPSKRQKSNRDLGTESECKRLRKKLTDLRTKLLETEATVFQHSKIQKQEQELFEEERNILETQVQNKNRKIEKLKKQLGESVRQTSEARKAQAAAEAKLLRLKSTVERRITSLMTDLNSEESSDREIKQEIKREDEDPNDWEGTFGEELICQPDLNPQDIKLEERSDLSQTLMSEKSTWEERNPLQGTEQWAEELKEESTSTENIVAYVDLTQKKITSKRQKLLVQNDTKDRNDSKHNKRNTLVGAVQQLSNRGTWRTDEIPKEEVKSEIDESQGGKCPLHRSTDKTRNNPEESEILMNKTDVSTFADDEESSSELEYENESSLDSLQPLSMLEDSHDRSEYSDAIDDGDSSPEASNDNLDLYSSASPVNLSLSENDSDDDFIEGQSNGAKRRKLRPIITIGTKHHVLVSSRFFGVDWKKECSQLGPGQWACNKCPRILKKEERAQDHVWVYHYGGKFECPHCTRSRTFFSCRQSIRKHSRRQHPSLYESRETVMN